MKYTIPTTTPSMKAEFELLTKQVHNSYSAIIGLYELDYANLMDLEIDNMRTKLLTQYYWSLSLIFKCPKHWFYDEDFSELNESIWEMSIYKDMYGYLNQRAYYENKIAGLCNGVENLSNYDEIDLAEVFAMNKINEEG